MTQYYLHRNGENFGPYEQVDFQNYVKDGQILPDEKVCIAGEDEWKPAAVFMSNLASTPASLKPTISNEASPAESIPTKPTFNVGGAAPKLVTSGTTMATNTSTTGVTGLGQPRPAHGVKTSTTDELAYPTPLKVAGWFMIIQGALLSLISILLIAMPSIIIANIDTTKLSADGQQGITVMIGAGAGILIYGILAIIAGVGLLKKRKSAHTFAIVVAIIGILLTLFTNLIMIAALVMCLLTPSRDYFKTK